MSTLGINKRRVSLGTALFVLLVLSVFPLFNFVFGDHRISCSPADWERHNCDLILVYFDAGDSGLQECQYQLRNVDSGYSSGWLNAQSIGINTCSGDTTALNAPIAVGTTGNCRDQGSQKCIIDWRAKDKAGNERIELDIQRLNIDYTLPSVGLVSPTSAVTNVATTFSAAVSDATSNINACDFYVNNAFVNNMTLSGAPVSSASVSYAFTAAGNYGVRAQCNDKAGNFKQGTDVTVNVSDPTLTFPSGTWQRLWYTTSGPSPAFSTSNFLGEEPNQSTEKFTDNWDGDTQAIAHGKSNSIGFQSSRTINFPTADLYRFTLNSDDGSRLAIDSQWRVEQWYDGGNNTKFADVYITPAGNHIFQLDYYENGGSAKVSFDYALAPVCSAPTFPDCSVTPTSVLFGWTTVTGISEYEVQWKRSVDSTWSSAFTSSEPYDITGLTPNTTYNVKVKGSADNNTQCNAPTNFTSPMNCTTQACLKTTTLITDSFNVSTGSKSCLMQVTHLSADYSDGLGVKYESKGTPANSNDIEVDDEAGSNSCDLDIRFTNSWSSPSTSVGKVRSQASAYNATHILGYGYQLSSNNCVIQSYALQTCASDPDTGFACPSELDGTLSLSADRRSVTTVGRLNDFSAAIPDNHEFNYTMVECLNNTHCATQSGADPSKAICNLGITANFPQNTCIDSVKPTSSITNVRRTNPDPKDLGVPGPNQWLKAGTYEVSVSDQDSGIFASNLQSCDYFVNDIGPTRPGIEKSGPRTCSSTFSFTVGIPGSGANCETQERSFCQIQTGSVDRAGNIGIFDIPLNIDTTAPSAK
jgi:hypothetical protein